MRIIHPQDVSTLRGIVAATALIGFMSALPMVMIIESGGGGSNAGVVIAWMVIGYLLIPLACLAIFRCHLASPGRRILASFFMSIGAMIPLVTLKGPPLIDVLSFLLIAMLLLFGTWCLLGMLAWPVIIRVWPFRLQDGQTCPQCGYCLRGVTSRVCPECGRGFDANDLGLSEAAFDELTSGAQVDSSVAAST